MDKIFKKIWKDFGEKRENQLEIANIIDETLHLGKKYSIITSPPGTGKTVGYLVPAIRYSIETGIPVIISTSTRSLQDQICNDIDRLRKHFVPCIKASVLKGKNNYLDRDRFLSFLSENLIKDKVNGVDISEFLQWMKATEDGDLSTVKVPDTIPESAYTHGSYFYERALGKAMDANIIITNHSVVLTWVKMNMLERSYLPPELMQNVIFDEADQLDKAIKNVFSVSVAISRLRRLSAIFMDVVGKDQKKHVTEIYNKFDSYMEDIQEIKNGDSYRIGKDEKRKRQFKKTLTRIQSDMDNLMGIVKRSRTKKKTTRAVVMEELERKQKNISLLLRKVTADPWNTAIMYSSVYRYPSFEYNGNIQKIQINRHLWSQLRSACFISATIYEARFFLDGIGLPHEEKFIDILADCYGVTDILNKHKITALKSPFPFQADVFYPPETWSAPAARKATSENHEYYENLCSMVADSSSSARNVLVLFGSYGGINQFFEHARENKAMRKLLLNECNLTKVDNSVKFPVILDLLENGRNILLATGDYWIGKDFPKDSINSLVIAKLPFAQSLLEDKMEFQKNFLGDILPRAVTQFVQGCGRLIRGHDYKGTIYIADSRIVTKSYGSRFRKYLEQNFKSFCTYGVQDAQVVTMEARKDTASGQQEAEVAMIAT